MAANDKYGIEHDAENRFWYNIKTGEVEQGFLSPAANRVGPFDTRAEAENALETLRANSARWAEEDAND